MVGIFCFLVIYSVYCADYFEVQGSPYEIGFQLGNKMNETIIQMYNKKIETYKEHIQYWEKIADKSLASIEKYAPVTFLEMKGMSDAPGISMKIISMINTEYEMSMIIGESSKKCSGFAASSLKYGTITGQTNDENPSDFLGMNGIVVQKRSENGPENSSTKSLIFTHHGYMMYMGINSDGLVVEWQYIDNGEYNLDGEFVPSTVLLREMLTKNSIFDAAMYLKTTPQGVCNNFMLTKYDEGVIDVELSPTNFTMIYQPNVEYENVSTDLCHSNTIVFSQPMMDHDVCVDPTSRPRYNKCRELTKKFREENGGMDLDSAKEWLFTPPIKRDGKWEGIISLAVMIFQSKERIMNIKFYEDKEFRIYKL